MVRRPVLHRMHSAGGSRKRVVTSKHRTRSVRNEDENPPDFRRNAPWCLKIGRVVYLQDEGQDDRVRFSSRHERRMHHDVPMREYRFVWTRCVGFSLRFVGGSSCTCCPSSGATCGFVQPPSTREKPCHWHVSDVVTSTCLSNDVRIVAHACLSSAIQLVFGFFPRPIQTISPSSIHVNGRQGRRIFPPPHSRGL